MSVINQDTCATQNHRLSEGAKQAETQIDTKVDLDTILVNELGAFGKYHVRTLAFAVFALMFSGFHSEYVFTSARINTRCLISECEDRGSEFSPAWIHDAIPTKAGSLEKCYRYGTANITSTSWNDTCNVIFNTSAVQKCEERMYENKQTVVYDFDLGCDEWRRTIIGSARMIGSVFSLPSTGFISDRWGRRTALVINCVNSGWIGVTRYWINWYPLFVLSGFFESFFGAGMFSSAYLLILELLAPKHRTFAGGFVGVCIALGHILLGLIAWNLQYWRSITLALYVPHLFGIGYLWAAPESIRWYVSKGRYTESEDQLKKMAKMNKKILSAKSLELLRVNAEEEKLRKQEEIIQKYQEPCLVSLIFRHKRILIRCLLVPFCWITGYLVYFGLSINSVNISGNNKYLNFITVTSVEIPGLFLAIYLPNKIGRKRVLAGSFWICAACQCAYVFMPKDMYWLSLCIYLVGKCTSSTIMSTLYVFTSELFPTKYRHSLLAYCAVVGKIGSAMAPLTPAIGASTFPEMPFILFGIFALVAGCLVLPLPETLGRKLPDSLEEAEAF